jgi:hypothetical protein
MRFRLPSWFFDIDEARQHPTGLRVLNFVGYFFAALVVSFISRFLFSHWVASLIICAVVGLVMTVALDFVYGLSTWPAAGPGSSLAKALWIAVGLVVLGIALALGSPAFVAGAVTIVVVAILSAIFSGNRR